MAIRMIGLDLDGTSLDDNSKFTDRTLDVFKRAKAKGIHIVIATGRALQSIPKELYTMPEVEYVITSNGARVITVPDAKSIYTNCIDADRMKDIYDILVGENATIEVFVDGNAYISREEYDDVLSGRITHRSKDYIIKSRTPIDNIYDLLLDHKGSVENININYNSVEERAYMEPKLETISGVTLTSSLPLNNEIGGKTTSKADALAFLINKLGVARNELMCCGDNPNDIAMIKMAEIGVAMGNADEEVKAEADFVTLPNYEDGVAYAIEKYAL